MPLRLRYPLALGAGLLLAAAFPKIGIAGAAWIAPGLMLGTAIGTDGKTSFRLGFVAGLAFWLASLYWLLLIPVTGFPILGWVALSAFVALFQGIWVWLCWMGFPTGPAITNTSGPEPESLRIPHSALHVVHGSSRLSRFRWTLFCATLWVALEMIRSRIFSGFPWSLLGVSQYELTPLIQISASTGVYGVSFLVVWTSASLLCAGLMIFRPPTNRSAFAAEVFLPFLAVAIIFATGYHRITHAPGADRSVRLTVVQPSIPQTMIWDAKADDHRFADLMALSERALSNKPADALIWPEAAMPAWSEDNFSAITNLAIRHGVSIILGADDVERRPNATRPDDVDYFNGAWLISPRGFIADTYHKRRLVIFGEYVPLIDWLPFIQWLTPITGSFTAGKTPTQFPLRDSGVITAPLICFEDVFPHGAREHVNPDTDLLVNLTNDGWFGESAAQWQQAANAIFRAVENGVPLVRACNNGLTCWIDPQGRIREIFRDEQGTIYGAGYATFTVSLEDSPHPATFYNRQGDVFGWACVALAAIVVASNRIRRKR